MKSASLYSHLKSIIALPAVVTIAIPWLLLTEVPEPKFFMFSFFGPVFSQAMGIVFFLFGFSLFVQSVLLFISMGKGTLAPWDPTKNIVVESLYRHVRNPMILGVLFILFGEGFFFYSLPVLIWAVLFFIVNHVYFIYKEEPGLLKRFGSEYQAYRKNVPRWLPRIKGWRPENDGE